MSKIAIFASGTGSNADRLIRYFRLSKSNIEVGAIFTNRVDSGVVEIAKKNEVNLKVFNNHEFKEGSLILKALESLSIDWIVLAGFLRKIPAVIIDKFQNRIFNVHPALLPKYGGHGMYGRFVHEAVLENKESESGITIHLVDQDYDRGVIIFQKSCPVYDSDTFASLAERVQTLEHEYLPKVIEEYVLENRLRV